MKTILLASALLAPLAVPAQNAPATASAAPAQGGAPAAVSPANPGVGVGAPGQARSRTGFGVNNQPDVVAPGTPGASPVQGENAFGVGRVVSPFTPANPADAANPTGAPSAQGAASREAEYQQIINLLASLQSTMEQALPVLQSVTGGGTPAVAGRTFGNTSDPEAIGAATSPGGTIQSPAVTEGRLPQYPEPVGSGVASIQSQAQAVQPGQQAGGLAGFANPALNADELTSPATIQQMTVVRNELQQVLPTLQNLNARLLGVDTQDANRFSFYTNRFYTNAYGIVIERGPILLPAGKRMLTPIER